MQILIGTYNKGKVEEIIKIINEITPGRIEFALPQNVLKHKIHINETGATFADNAYIKAKAFFESTSLPSISDDSGLEVDALNGEPGINSARYSGSNSNDADNRRKLLEELKDVPQEKRKAQFRTCICLYGNNTVIFSEGVCYGEIAYSERGSGGFGYDSIFIPEGHLKTFAEMSDEEKNALSHRRKAIDSFVQKLLQRFEHDHDNPLT
jgi:XTP/dITP diphosphohydrolase